MDAQVEVGDPGRRKFVVDGLDQVRIVDADLEGMAGFGFVEMMG